MSRESTRLLLVDARPRTAALAALAAAVEADPDLAGVEVRFVPPGPPLRSALDGDAGAGPVVVGWSFATAGFPAAAAALRALERTAGSAVHVAGGPHPSADPDGVLRAGFPLAAIGEGEGTLAGLLRRVARGEPAVGPGLAWLEDGSLRRGERPPPVDLDATPPFPERLRRLGPIEISRGCSFACRFCQTTSLHGGRVRHRSPRRIAEAAGQVAARGGRDVRFVTPSALSYGSPDGAPRLEALEEMLVRVREAVGPAGRIWLGTFPSEVRPEHVTPGALALLRRHVANRELAIGAQSGSDAVLDACHRGHRADDVRRAVRLAAEAGFRAKVDLIFGLPGETPDDAEASRALAVELAAVGAEIHAHAFLPLPGTPWAGAGPGRIDERTRELLLRLAGSGRLSGPWMRQEALARQALAGAEGATTPAAAPRPRRSGA
ncbi:MAG TPA: TIGR04013 family B12-binding domain/radical SAM domain-containing protein [Anaeromyxobacteraceae bacterium]|nr:TIGR04013 family B12-binding domain/radical SAM domain-containing protein [Anaeromyxobacteraceae bacterium]